MLIEQGPPLPKTPKMVQKRPLGLSMSPPDPPTPPPRTLTTGQRMFNLIQGAFEALNASNPETTSSCWLCLASAPPYYEGIAIAGLYNFSDQPHERCAWESRTRLTLTEVTGTGLCLGRVPQSYQRLCNSFIHLQENDSGYLIPKMNMISTPPGINENLCH